MFPIIIWSAFTQATKNTFSLVIGVFTFTFDKTKKTINVQMNGKIIAMHDPNVEDFKIVDYNSLATVAEDFAEAVVLLEKCCAQSEGAIHTLDYIYRNVKEHGVEKIARALKITPAVLQDAYDSNERPIDLTISSTTIRTLKRRLQPKVG